MIYLDAAASSRVTDKVINDITWCLKNVQGNPSSPHSEGHKAKLLLEESRKKVADFINAEPEEIIFCSSGSEANNLAIRGYLDSHWICDCIITTNIEHPSVLNTCKMYETSHRVEYALVDSEGRVDLSKFHKLISALSYKYFCFVTIMLANNEIGTIQPIKEIAREVHRLGGVLHVDATQAVGNILVDVKDLDCDMLTFSSHKVGCPRGIGVLHKKRSLDIEPLVYGGHQERGYHAGTENVAMIYALGNQLDRIKAKKFPNIFETSLKRSLLFSNISLICMELGIECIENGGTEILPNILSLTLKGIDAAELITLLDEQGICISAGSACSSGEKVPSRILKAIGLSDEDALSTIRISIGHETTIEECDEFIVALKWALTLLKMVDVKEIPNN